MDSNFDAEILKSNQISADWFASRFNETLKEIEQKLNDYKLSEALMSIYKLIWDDFCSWYLEMVKPAYQQPIDESSYKNTIQFFEELMKLLHPFMPFITEEIWQNLPTGQAGLLDRKDGDSICIAKYPSLVETYNYTSPQIVTKDNNYASNHNLSRTFETITKIRELRNSKGLSPKEAFEISIKANDKNLYEPFLFLIKKLANVSAIHFVNEKQNNAQLIPVNTDEVYVFLNLEIDADAEKIEITGEIEYLEGFLKSVDAKLANEKFVANAKPELVEKERQKKADALAKIEVLKNNLSSL